MKIKVIAIIYMISAMYCPAMTHAAGVENVSPGVTTPRIKTPSPVLDGSRIILPAPLVKDIPAGAETYKFVLKRLDIEGAFGDLASTLPDFYSEYIDREITIVELFNIALAIQRAYHEAGFFLIQVFVPAQTIDDGIARIVISEAHISDIDVSALPERYQKKVKAIITGLVDTPHIKRDVMERKLLLVNNLAGLTVETILIPGQEPRSTILVFESIDRLVTGNFLVDNFASDSLRNEEGTLSLSLNSPTGHGEQFVFQGTLHPTLNELGRHQPVRVSGQLAAYIPLGNDGVSFNADIIRSVTHPRGLLTPLEIRGRLNDWSAGLSYPLILTRHNVLNLYGEYEYLDEVLQTDLLGPRVTLTHDSLRILHFSASWIHKHGKGGQFSLGGQLSQGLDILGARDDPDGGPALSRVDGEVEFTKLETFFTSYLPLSKQFTTSFSAKAQITSDPLLVSQQFTLGGPDFGSGQPIGAVLGDYGFAVRGELHRPFPVDVQGYFLNIQPYIFSDFGRAYLKNPTVAEQKFTTVADAGVGMRLTLLDNDASYRSYTAYFEYAKQLDGPADEDNGHKLSFTVGINY